METLKFKCELLSDVILNQKSATEGNRTTLDFIPGNNFLGIVASQLYTKDITKATEEKQKKAMILFHTGNVKFGDAHPSVNGIRSLKVPAAMFYPKLGKVSEQCFIHYLIPNLSSPEMKAMQLKQCRNGFYCFSPDMLNTEEVPIYKSFSIKSAYDKNLRRSKDEMMYGYEALRKGMEFLFEITLDEKSNIYKEEIISSLIGQRRIGRSRTAQYGLVNIEEFSYLETTSSFQPFSINGKDYIAIYADSRLIFLDDYGIPTFRPSAKDLGVENGEVDWEKSQIRIFQYAPWNYKRQVYDTDRCGIEKGSVFIIKLESNYKIADSQYVGFYQNEGFGKVIYNPDFLETRSNSKIIGETKYKFINKEPIVNQHDIGNVSSPLLSFLQKQKTIENSYSKIYERVNSFVEENKLLYANNNPSVNDSFASQWGTIRSIAMRGGNIEEEIFNYLTHGIAADKWLKTNKLSNLKTFMDNTDREYFQETIINLSSEMAKVCKKGKI